MKNKKWPEILYLIRHGQSERNVAKELALARGENSIWCDGIRDQDTVLTPFGITQAQSVGQFFRGKHPSDEAIEAATHGYQENPIDAMFVSPYLRARQTANNICAELGYNPKLIIEERIREIEFGLLDGLTPEGVRVKYPEEVARRAKEGKYYYRPPGGENRPDVNLRLHSFIDTLVRDYAGQIVAVVCHSVVVLCLRHLLERWEEARYLEEDREEDVRNASITTYVSPRNKIRLESFNQVYYTNTPSPSQCRGN